MIALQEFQELREQENERLYDYNLNGKRGGE